MLGKSAQSPPSCNAHHESLSLGQQFKRIKLRGFLTQLFCFSTRLLTKERVRGTSTSNGFDSTTKRSKESNAELFMCCYSAHFGSLSGGVRRVIVPHMSVEFQCTPLYTGIYMKSNIANDASGLEFRYILDCTQKLIFKYPVSQATTILWNNKQ